MIPLPNLDGLPIEILESRRAVVWNFHERDGKATKVPYQAHRPNEKAAVDQPSTWAPFQAAYDSVADGKATGVGIVLGEGLVGVDLDGVRDPESGQIDAAAEALIRELDSYTEISPSGRGVHVLVHGALPPGRRRHGPVEMYSEGRYFTVTGAHVDGTPPTIHERTDALARLHAQVFPPEPDRPTDARAADPSAALSDPQVIAQARRARNAARFAALWDGDTSAYDGDDSAADLALCNLLAFWTGRDAERIDRLFRQSGLMRPKWSSRRGTSTYGADTIAKAIRDCRETYTRAPEIVLEAEPAPMSRVTTLVIDDGRALAAHAETAPPVPMLVTGLLMAFGTWLLHGDWRTLKTWTMLELLIAGATGTLAFGLLPVPARFRSLLITNEDGAGRLGERIGALVRGRDRTLEAGALGISAHRGVWFDDPVWRDRVTRAIPDHGYQVVALDPLRSITGAVDQGPREFQPFGLACRELIAATNITLAWAHHDTKPLAGQPDTRRRGHRASGGGIVSAADCPVHVERVGEDPRIVLTPAAWKHAADPPPIDITLATEMRDGKLWTAQLVGTPATATTAKELVLEGQIVAVLRESPGVSGSDVARKVRANKQAVLTALTRLEAQGVVDSCVINRRGGGSSWMLAEVVP